MIIETTPRSSFSDWEDYYADPLKFSQLFHDHSTLRETQRTRPLTTEEAIQARAVHNIIEGRLSS